MSSDLSAFHHAEVQENIATQKKEKKTRRDNEGHVNVSAAIFFLKKMKEKRVLVLLQQEIVLKF